METLIFATNNQHKIDEVRLVLGNKFSILTLQEAGIDIDIPEPFETLEENAAEKSGTIARLTGRDCFSEDSGLEVLALNGEPGVHSARYAGDGRSSQDNINKLLDKLGEQTNRAARFRTIISLQLNGQETQFEGVCEGAIIATPRGFKGFGYDPIFIPTGSTQTFAEMTAIEKNSFSHRKKAMDKLIDYLQQLQQDQPGHLLWQE